MKFIFLFLLSILSISMVNAMNYNITQSRSIILNKDIGEKVYVSEGAILENPALEYRPKPFNIALEWDTKYTYEKGTFEEVIKNDNSTGWNPFPNLYDGGYGDGATSLDLYDPNNTEKSIIPKFTFKKPYIISYIKIIGKTNNTKDFKVDLFASGKHIGTYNLSFKEDYSDIIIKFNSIKAKDLTINISSKANYAIGEIEIYGVADYVNENQVEIENLTPTKTYNIATKLNGKLETAKVYIPKILEYPNLSEHFGVNVHLEQYYQNFDMLEESIKLLKESGTKSVRWYAIGGYQRVLSCLKKYGIASLNSVVPENNFMSWCMNEPELAKVTPKQAANIIKENKTKQLELNPYIPLIAPTCMSDSYEYISSILNQINKDDIDAYDFHPYAKLNVDPLPGIDRNLPEDVENIFITTKKMLKDCNMEQLPLIASEFGFTTYDGSTFIQAVDLDTQSNYMVRQHLVHIAMGAKASYYYDFRDDGTDKSNMEHNWGLVYNDLKKKPSFYAYKFMTESLGDKVFVKRNVDIPLFTYIFKNLEKNKYVTVFVNAKNRTLVDLKNNDKIKVYNVYGKEIKLKDNSIMVYGSPIYVMSKKELKVKYTTMDLEKVEALTVSADNLPKVVTGDKIDFSILVKNTFNKDLTGTLTAKSDLFDASKELSIKENSEIKINISEPIKAKDTGLYDIDIKVNINNEEKIFKFTTYYIKPASEDLTSYTIKEKVSGEDLVIVESKDLHIVIAPFAGSRLFRVIDKRTLGDQIYVPKNILSNKVTIQKNDGAGDWFSFNGWTGFILDKKFNYKVDKTENYIAVVMTAQINGYDITHTIKIDKNKSNVIQNTVDVKNISDKEATIFFMTHPQLTPGSALEFGKVDISIPSGGTIKGNAFLAFRGDMGVIAPDKNYWRAKNLNNNYTVTCNFDEGKVENIRQWHDGEFFNMELNYKPNILKPNDATTFNYDYTFTN